MYKKRLMHQKHLPRFVALHVHDSEQVSKIYPLELTFNETGASKSE